MIDKIYNLKYASAGIRIRVNCLEGSYTNHYTTDAYDNKNISLNFI